MYQRAPRKILVICTNMLGDTLMMTSVIRSLRSAWPEAVIDVLLCRATPDILEGNPDINQVLQIAKRPTRQENWQLFKRICRRYDLALTNQTNDRVMIYSLVAAARRIGRVPATSGFNNWWRKQLFSRYFIKDHNEAVMLQNMRLVRLLGIPECNQVVPPSAPLPALGELHRLSQLNQTQRPLAIVHPIASSPLKHWKAESWCEVLGWLWQQGLQPVLSGGPAPEELAALAQISQRCQHPLLDFSGQLSLGQWAELLKHAKVYAGADTSMSHLAAACGVPTVTLFSSTPPSRWGPWPRGYHESLSPFAASGPLQQRGQVITVQGELDCVPCGAKYCLKTDSKTPQCLQELPAERVIEALARLLTPPDQADSTYRQVQQAKRGEHEGSSP